MPPCHLTDDTYPGLSDSHLWYISTFSPKGIAFKNRYSLALFMQGVLTLHSLNSVAATLTVSLPKGFTSIDRCTTQLIPTSFACWSSTSMWPGNLTQNRGMIIKTISLLVVHLRQRSKSLYVHAQRARVQHTFVRLQLHSELNKVKATVTLMKSFHDQQKEGTEWCYINCGTKCRVILKDFR